MNCRKAAREAARGVRVRKTLLTANVRAYGACAAAECNLFKKEGRSFQLRPFLNIFYCAVRTVSSERFSRFTTGGATNTISTAVAAPEMIRNTRPPKT